MRTSSAHYVHARFPFIVYSWLVFLLVLYGSVARIEEYYSRCLCNWPRFTFNLLNLALSKLIIADAYKQVYSSKMSWTGQFWKQANKNPVEKENHQVVVTLRVAERI